MRVPNGAKGRVSVLPLREIVARSGQVKPKVQLVVLMPPHQQQISFVNSRGKGVLDGGVQRRALLCRVMPLTRSQVARRLGRSIATVRALEARGVLSPRRGPRGRRLFDVDQVDEVVADAAATGRLLPRGEVAKFAAARRQVAGLESSGVVLRTELEFVRAQVLEVVEELLDTAPRRASVLAALERLVDIVR